MPKTENANKTFKFFNSNDVKSLDHRSSQQKKPGGVRVKQGQGDRAVGPSKSKPKKRTNLEGHDMSAISMESVEWSSRTYSVKEVVQHFGSQMPVIAKVIQGFHHSSSGLELSTGQVVQLYTFGQQDRMKAQTKDARYVSLPLDYPADVQVTEKGDNEIMRLESAVRKYSMPLRVTVTNTEPEANITTNIVGEDLYILEGQEDIYIMGNTIQGGWIDQTHILVIPSFVEAEFAVAVGMHGAEEDEWDDFHKMFSRSVRHLQFKHIHGYDGVFYMDNVADPRDIRLSIFPPKQSSSRGGGGGGGGGEMYQNLPQQQKSPTRSPGFSVSGFNKSPPDNRNGDNVYENLGPSKPSNPSRNSQMIGVRVLPDAEGGGLQRSQKSPSHINRGYIKSKGDGESGDELDVTEMFDNVLKVAEEEENDKKSNSVKDRAQKFSPASNRYNVQAPPRAVVPPTVQQKSRLQQPKPGGGPFVIQLNVGDIHRSNNNDMDKSKSKSRTRGTIRFSSIEEVPNDIESLTVEEVCECLTLMNMDNHCSEFRKHQVDGKLLSGIKENVLIKDFKFTDFNASKLMRFVRGWRPKIS